MGLCFLEGMNYPIAARKEKPRVLAEVLKALIGAIFRMKGCNSAKAKIQWMNKLTRTHTKIYHY
jgi:dsRNA-specific ribonuclease